MYGARLKKGSGSRVTLTQILHSDSVFIIVTLKVLINISPFYYKIIKYLFLLIPFTYIKIKREYLELILPLFYDRLLYYYSENPDLITRKALELVECLRWSSVVVLKRGLPSIVCSLCIMPSFGVW